jgi:3-oxoacyl-[acyl-carrier protein] reductase
MKLQGKVAIVTGAGNGIGRATAEKLFAEGVNSVLTDIDETACRELTARFPAERVTVICGDLTHKNVVESIVASALSKFGDLHIIINNAGYPLGGAIEATSDENWTRMLDIHATAPFRLLRAAAPYIQRAVAAERVSGRPTVRKVVNVSSLAVQGAANLCAYGAAKAAVAGLTKALSKEWGPLGVNVNCVVFGHIETRLSQPLTEGSQKLVRIGDLDVPVGVPQAAVATVHALTPLRRSGSVQEAAGAIALFCYPESDFITGELVSCSGGLSF